MYAYSEVDVYSTPLSRAVAVYRRRYSPPTSSFLSPEYTSKVCTSAPRANVQLLDCVQAEHEFASGGQGGDRVYSLGERGRWCTIVIMRRHYTAAAALITSGTVLGDCIAFLWMATSCRDVSRDTHTPGCITLARRGIASHRHTV